MVYLTYKTLSISIRLSGVSNVPVIVITMPFEIARERVFGLHSDQLQPQRGIIELSLDLKTSFT